MYNVFPIITHQKKKKPPHSQLSASANTPFPFDQKCNPLYEPMWIP